jgi:hypothetical protein
MPKLLLAQDKDADISTAQCGQFGLCRFKQAKICSA